MTFSVLFIVDFVDNIWELLSHNLICSTFKALLLFSLITKFLHSFHFLLAGNNFVSSLINGQWCYGIQKRNGEIV